MFLDDTADKIVAALPTSDGDPINFREVHRRVGCWAATTIRNALVELERDGRVQSVLEPFGQNFVRLWRQADEALAMAD